jgi:exonuclease VII small subunit
MDQFSGFVKIRELNKAQQLDTSIELLKASKETLFNSKEKLKKLNDESLEKIIVDLDTQINNFETRISEISALRTKIEKAANTIEIERQAEIERLAKLEVPAL